jgi:predicted alpha/beta superfamily hydrolase
MREFEHGRRAIGQWVWLGAALFAVVFAACGDPEASAQSDTTVADTLVEPGDTEVSGPDSADLVAPEADAESDDADSARDTTPADLGSPDTDALDVADGAADTTRSPATVTLTLPPETPAGATLELAVQDAGGPQVVTTTVGSVTTGSAAVEVDVMVTGSASVEVRMVAPEELWPVANNGAFGNAHRLSVAGGAGALTVSRWGTSSAGVSPLWVLLARVPPTSAGTIHVSGNRPDLGDWDGVGQAMYRTIDGRWAARLALPSSTQVEYKLTRGSWETVEKGFNGVEIPNRVAVVTGDVVRTEVEVIGWRDAEAPPLSNPRIVHVPSFASPPLTPSRDLWIYLPPGYDSDTTRRYPVLYMHDGQNLFSPTTSAFGVEWRVDEAADAGILAGQVEPVIIVGIESTVDRMSEYTHVVDADYGGGNSAKYGQFLVNTLKPYIDAGYRTKTDAASTGLAGSSLGGLVSLYLGLEYANVFTRLGVVSPSVWWSNKEIVGRVAGLASKPAVFVWLDIGTAEGSGSAVGNTRELRDAMVGRGWVLDADLVYREYQGAAHNEASWAERFGEILRTLYPAD